MTVTPGTGKISCVGLAVTTVQTVPKSTRSRLGAPRARRCHDLPRPACRWRDNTVLECVDWRMARDVCPEFERLNHESANGGTRVLAAHPDGQVGITDQLDVEVTQLLPPSR